MEIAREQLDEIQKLGEYHAAVRTLRWPAVAGIVFGLITLVSVAMLLADDDVVVNWPVLIAVVAISVGQVIVGLWHLLSPSLGALTSLAILMIVIGCWNVLFGGDSYDRPGGSYVHINIFALIQIGVGIHTLATCRRLRGHFPVAPSPETVRSMEHLVRTIRGLKLKEQENVIEFHFRPFIGRNKRWRGLLLDDAAIFVTRHRDVLCGTRGEVSIQPRRRLLLQSVYKAVLDVGGKRQLGRISKQSLERYQAWKAAADAAPEGPFASDLPGGLAE